MENNYKTKTGTFKSLKHFSEKGMLIGQTDYNNDFYDIFAGETCEFAVFEDGSVFHKDTKAQVNPDDIDFGCDSCNQSNKWNDLIVKGLSIIGLSSELCVIKVIANKSTRINMNINYCPMCGRKLKIDE